jgi:hypothetical protein
MTILDQSVSSPDEGATWDFVCPVYIGCGDPTPGGIGFTSKGWPTKKVALARGRQHFDEHKGLGVSPPLHRFRIDQGLTVDTAGVVKVEDL